MTEFEIHMLVIKRTATIKNFSVHQPSCRIAAVSLRISVIRNMSNWNQARLQLIRTIPDELKHASPPPD